MQEFKRNTKFLHVADVKTRRHQPGKLKAVMNSLSPVLQRKVQDESQR